MGRAELGLLPRGTENDFAVTKKFPFDILSFVSSAK